MKRSLTIRYALHQLLYWAAAAGVISFASTYLLAKGFQPSQVGALMACYGVLSCLTQPFIASVADCAKKNVLPAMLAILASVCVVSFGSLCLLPLPRLLFGLLYLIGGWAFNLMVPLMNSVYVHYSDCGYSIHYGLAKGVEALSFSVATLAMGNLIAWRGMDAMLWASLVLLGLLVVTVLGYPKTEKRNQEGHAGVECCSVGKFFVRYRWYCLSLAGVAFLAMFHAMTENYLVAILERLGGNSSHVGTALFIASVTSVPVMVCFEKIRRCVSDQWLLKLSGIFFVGKAAIFLLAPNIQTIYAAQLLQMTTYSFLSPAQVYYAKEKVASADMVKGQSFITAAYALGCAMGNLLGGTLIEGSGVETLLVTGVALTVLGTVILFATVGKKDQM